MEVHSRDGLEAWNVMSKEVSTVWFYVFQLFGLNKGHGNSYIVSITFQYCLFHCMIQLCFSNMFLL